MTEKLSDRAKYQRALQRQRDRANGIGGAYEMWQAGKVVPDRITTALNLNSLYGPEVDHACGVEEPAVDEWEAGTRYPTWDQLAALSLLTGFPVGWFVRPVTAVLTGVIMCESGPPSRCGGYVGPARILAYPPEVYGPVVGAS